MKPQHPDHTRNREQATFAIFKFFAYDHLPEPLRTISERSYLLAEEMLWYLPDCPELRAGLRKLLEAKDCFVRTAVAEGLLVTNNETKKEAKGGEYPQKQA